MRKRATLLLIVLLTVSSLIVAKTVPASASIPSIPEFNVELVGPSFDIPPTYSFNSSTGLFDANDGYHIEYSAVKIIIKNQPFSNQTNGDYLYYNVRIKPHNYPDSYWLELFYAGYDGYPIQTLSNYTTIPLPVEGAQVLGTTIPTGATTDIQVESMIGHIGRNQTMVPYPYPYVFFGETSGWSNTQTVTLPPKTPFSPSPSPSPQSTPTIEPDTGMFLPASLVYAIAITFVALFVILVVLVIRRRK